MRRLGLQAGGRLSSRAPAGATQRSFARLPDLGRRSYGEGWSRAGSGRTQSAIRALLRAENCGRKHHGAERRNRRHRRQQRGRGGNRRRSTWNGRDDKDSTRRMRWRSSTVIHSFTTIGDAIMTGPTGNNVRDLRILLAYAIPTSPKPGLVGDPGCAAILLKVEPCNSQKPDKNCKRHGEYPCLEAVRQRRAERASDDVATARTTSDFH